MSTSCVYKALLLQTSQKSSRERRSELFLEDLLGSFMFYFLASSQHHKKRTIFANLQPRKLGSGGRQEAGVRQNHCHLGNANSSVVDTRRSLFQGTRWWQPENSSHCFLLCFVLLNFLVLFIFSLTLSDFHV